METYDSKLSSIFSFTELLDQSRVLELLDSLLIKYYIYFRKL